MVVKVNYAQCTLAFRSHRLEELAGEKLGKVTGVVYGALLRVLETKIKTRDDVMKEEHDDDDDEDDRSPTVLLSEVFQELSTTDPDIDLSLGIEGHHGASKTTSSARKKPKKTILDPEYAELGIKKEIYSDSEDEHAPNGIHSITDRGQNKILIEEHLKLLQEYTPNFCNRAGAGGGGEYRVHFPALVDLLVKETVKSNVKARYGHNHAMMINLFNDRGRLEEKTVSHLVIRRVKDVRALLTEMQFAGLAEVQEVPKDGSRQPQRTHYLWFHDQSRVASQLTQQAYQAMARLFQRLKAERETYKGIIDKAEMIRARHADLTLQERNGLAQWRELEERILNQIRRVDDLVMLLRDYSERDTSLIS